MNPPAISKPVLGFFRHIVNGYFRRSFHGVRISHAEHFDPGSGHAPDPRPLILYANHASWWDPMVAILLGGALMPARRHYAPMDAVPLARYGILRRVGIFPVELNSGRGAVQFLRTGEAILRAGGVLWVTPQGRFTDPRERPLLFKPGLAALAARMGEGCRVLPLAIEYTFWNERLPECLLRFGEPVSVQAGERPNSLDTRLTHALEATMNDLQRLALARDPAPFRTLVEGRRGPGGFYALSKRLRQVFTPNASTREPQQGPPS